MKFNLKLSALTAALSVAMATTAFAADMLSIEHKQGTTEIPANPQKVITFDIATLDTLDAIGVNVHGVPSLTFPANLEKYGSDDYAKYGSLFEPDYEAVNAAAPDLIIVAGRSSGAYEQLSAIAPTIDLSNEWGAAAVETYRANSRILGEIFGKQDEIAAIEAEVDASIAALQAAAEGIGDVFTVMTSGGKVSAYGAGSRFGFIYDTLGLIPTIEDVEAATHGEAISNEFILETNPSWLIVLDRDAAIGRDGESAQATLDNELVAQTTAWTNDQVIYVDTARWYITNGGIANLNVILKDLSAALIQE